MHYILLLHGLVHRSLRHTIESLRRNVIASLERLSPVEVFYHSWDTRGRAVHGPATADLPTATATSAL